jgi:hypothetical protein
MRMIMMMRMAVVVVMMIMLLMIVVMMLRGWWGVARTLAAKLLKLMRTLARRLLPGPVTFRPGLHLQHTATGGGDTGRDRDDDDDEEEEEEDGGVEIHDHKGDDSGGDDAVLVTYLVDKGTDGSGPLIES